MLNSHITKNTVLEEELIFVRSREGALGYNLPALDVPMHNVTTSNFKNYLSDTN